MNFDSWRSLIRSNETRFAKPADIYRFIVVVMHINIVQASLISRFVRFTFGKAHAAATLRIILQR